MAFKRNSFIFVSLSLFCFHQCFGLETEPRKIPLYISYIASINSGVGFSSAGGIPAFQIALEMINNSSDILANYSLEYTEILDSKCQHTTALDMFFQDFTRNPDNYTFIALVCCGCSAATIPVAEISHYWNVPQISHSAALTLNDGTRFRNFFRLLPTNRNLAFGIVRTAREFGWRKLLVISQNEELFTTGTSVLQFLFTAYNWIIDTSILIESSVNPFPLESIFKKIESDHYRIIMINTYSQFAYKIFCEAFQRNLIAPKYIWMTHLWYNTNWWLAYNNSPCTSEEIQIALKGSIGVIPDGYVFIDDSMPTSSGLTTSQFLEEYKERIEVFRINNASVPPVSLPNIGFDMAWTIGLGLEAAVQRIALNNDSGCEQLSGEIVPLEDFQYSNDKMGCILKQSMGSVEFDGFSGPIEFNENGSQPDNLLAVQQYKEIVKDTGLVERVTVVKIDIATDSFKNSTILWKEIPYDGYPEDSIDQYNIILFVIYITMSTAGLIFAIVCLIFNIAFRNKKVIKLSSPNLNYLIISGSIILYASVFVFIYMPSNVGKFVEATVICNLRIWLFSLGYTVCFAVILSKTWRVYYIFNNPMPKKKVMKDWMLLVIIAVIVVGDLIILLIGTSISASRLESDQIRSIENPTEVQDKLVKNNYIYVCLRKGSGPIIWLSISFAYKGLLQIIGMFMAFHIRKVKIKALNDSKQTAAIIYVNTILLIILTTSTFVLDDYHNGHAAIFGLGLIIDATLFLGALFVPKMINLYNDPKELKVFEEQSHSKINTASQLMTWQGNNNGESDKKDTENVLELQKQNEKLKQIIKNANINIPE